jgi:hypothetical protein
VHIPPSLLLTLLLLPLAVGCESFRSPLAKTTRGNGDSEEMRARQAAYRLEGDNEAIRWLLANRVESGMTLDEVESALGTDGEPVAGAAFKNRGGNQFHVTDEVYKWGPDSAGQAYYLVFRENLLFNFDRRQFR